MFPLRDTSDDIIRRINQSQPLSPSSNLLSFRSPRRKHTVFVDSPYREAYSTSPLPYEAQIILTSPRKPPRYISKFPYKVLDAPDLQDDFYLNLVDWSSNNILGVGLGTCVYLWNAVTSKVLYGMMFSTSLY